MSRQNMRHLSILAALSALMLLAMLIAPGSVEPIQAEHSAAPGSVTIAGSLQSALGCPGDWAPDCAATFLTYDAGDDVWQALFNVPQGNWEYKAALNGAWDENYGAGAVPDGPNIALNLDAARDVKFYYDHKSHWVTDNVNSVIATVPGDFQSELGCPGDWAPDCLRSWLQDPDGDGVYRFVTTAIPAGSYEAKVAINESWDENYGAGGERDGANIPFTVADGGTVTFSYDAASHILTIDVSGGADPGDGDLVRPPVRSAFSDEIFYFVLTDRFADGDPANNTAGSAGDVLQHGYLPTDKGYYHGGDLAGMIARLDYLDELGVTALWLTPPFTNRWVQGDGTIAGSSAAYHGYWQVDYTQIDPHFGSNAEMLALIDAAHDRGIKVFFDVVLNHTADLISYEEGVYSYRNKADFPYRDAEGNAFDDRDYAGTGTFPDLDPAISFPYTPLVTDDTAKNPAWLNNPIYYHNRGDSTFAGESSLYGDFVGLDDLFTEHPDVVSGLIDIHKNIISTFGVDGFRVDTVKHVNDEFWMEFVPQIMDHAAGEGIAHFTLFGEVFDGDPAYTSRFTTQLDFPSLLDFGFDGAAKNFAVHSSATDQLAGFFASDDWYTDADSNAMQLVKFIGNHDLGRLGREVDLANPGASDAERVARVQLAYALASFSRGVPLIYYGDEQGFTGDGGDKDARQDMFPSQVASYNDDDLIGTTATTAEDNFDATHPLYQAFAAFNSLRSEHLALRQGAQIHRYSEGQAGIYAFSRLERGERIEYVVALNNAESEQSATFATYSPNAAFEALYPAGGAPLQTDGDGNLTVTVPALGVAVYRATAALPAATSAPGIQITAPAAGAEVGGRFELAATLNSAAYAEVTFVVSVNGGDYDTVGTDDNAPYRVFYDASGLEEGTSLRFKAIASDLDGNLNSAQVDVTVGAAQEPGAGALYAVIHYFREDGDYGDHSSSNFNDYWGLHLWGDGVHPDYHTEWTSPRPFLGQDEYGRFAWVRLTPGSTEVNFIIHRGDIKDGTEADRRFNPAVTPEIWTRQGDPNEYTTQAEAQGYVTIHYHRPDGDYGDPGSGNFNDFWGLHLWGEAIDPAEGTTWDNPKPPTGFDDYGAYWNIAIQDVSQPVNFIVHRGDLKDTEPDRSFDPAQDASIWLQAGDETNYPSRGAATNVATIHYHRPAGDYGDNCSPDFNQFWGLHVWDGALNPNPGWTEPVCWDDMDTFGPIFNIPLVDGASQLAYIVHRGDEKDPGPDQFLILDRWGYEVWQLQGENPANPDEPHYVLPILAGGGASVGNIDQQRAYWVSEDTIAWAAATDPANSYFLHSAPEGGLQATETGVTGGSALSLTLDPAGLPQDARDKFPHLADLPALKIAADDLHLVPDILRGQIAVSALSPDGAAQDATGLQIPGVLDDLYTYDGQLGVSWDGGAPTLRLWAPTAKSVTLHLYADADPATSSTALPMTLDPQYGVWSISGDASWDRMYYLYEVEVYVHSTGAVEHNMVTDPYSFSLSMNSTRSQIVDLADATLAPGGWQSLAKPPLPAPEDISVYELHVRDFSVNDPSVPEALKGTYLAFTLPDSHGVQHLQALQQAGLTHLHLLPTFDIATINEDRSQWNEPDWGELASYPPDSEQQQALIFPLRDEDGFNWGYDPLHYTTPEGSYSTDPNGVARIVEYRQMVQALNEMGLRLVIDVVYNHTNAAGQSEKSVLDRVVPGYYHRLNDAGAVETSTCCQNTATEHNMMEKLMIDSVLTWAVEYKVDAFRFDLMGHHMKSNMLKLRAALDSLTLEEHGVDGQSIYVYGEGWDFGEVANNARGVNATQFNMAGTGIGTFSDRLRDAVRGPGPFNNGDSLQQQGFASGLFYDPNDWTSTVAAPEAQRAQLLLFSDQIRVGMAGNLATYEFVDRHGDLVTGAQVDYNGQPAGYTLDPQENISYVEKHDNQTLYDIYAYGMPLDSTMQERVRAQNVALSTVILGQGVPFTHAGSDLLRSKSFDRDSYNSGDWFNKLDFTYQSNNFGVGLPVQSINGENWYLMQPRLADPALQPDEAHIRQMAAMFQELLHIRYSSSLFRLQTAAEVQARLSYHNTGPDQIAGLIALRLADDGALPDLDPAYESIVVLLNANDEPQTITIDGTAGVAYVLHPVQQASVDPVVTTAAYDSGSGAFTVPGRTTAVFVAQEQEPATPQERLQDVIADVQALVDAGVLNRGQGNSLIVKLQQAIDRLDAGNENAAVNVLNAFINQVEAFRRSGRLTPAQANGLIEQVEDIIWQIQNT